MKVSPKKLFAKLRSHVFFMLVALTLSVNALAQQADIVFVVDTSSSMEGEVLAFQSSFNDAFALPILNASISMQIALIGSSSICIPAPTGSGNCPNDDNLPLYKHVVEVVGSTDALTKTLATYAQWQDQIRPNSRKAFVVLTDGVSGITAEDFESSLLTIDPAFSGYKFHAIVPSCDPLSEYAELATITGGTCNVASDAAVSSALQAIASDIISDFTNPPPPPPPTSCEDSAAAALDAGSAYVKVARVAKRTCRKAQDANCSAAVLETGVAFDQLSLAQSNLLTSCP